MISDEQYDATSYYFMCFVASYWLPTKLINVKVCLEYRWWIVNFYANVIHSLLFPFLLPKIYDKYINWHLTQLTELSLDYNFLWGKFLDKFSSSQKISRPLLGHNLLFGKFSNSLLNLTQLTKLYLEGYYLLEKIIDKFSSSQKISRLSLDHNYWLGNFQTHISTLRIFTF